MDSIVKDICLEKKLIHNLFPIDDALACQTIQDFEAAWSSFVLVSQLAQIRFPFVFLVETLERVSHVAEVGAGFPITGNFNAADLRFGHFFPDLYGAVWIFFFNHLGNLE